MGIVNNYLLAQNCIVNVSVLITRFEYIIGNLSLPAASINVQKVWVESTLSLGNVSTTYKGCYTSSEGTFQSFYYQILSYKSFTNYLLYLLPNMLSYAFVVNSWITKMTSLNEHKNYTGLAYYYGMIVKNVFFFTIPETASFTETVVPNLYSSLLYDEADDESKRLGIFHSFSSIVREY